MSPNASDFRAAADGRFLAAAIDHLEDNGAYTSGGSPGGGTMACIHLPGPYRIPGVGWRTKSVYTNTCGRGAYRGPWQIESVARELIVDILARDLGIDPLELRRRNILGPGDLPHTTATGVTYDRISPAECLEQAAEIIDYDGFRAEQRQARELAGRSAAGNGGPPAAGTLRVAAELMEASPDDLDLGGGAVSVRCTPARRMTVADVARAAYMHPDSLPADVAGGLEHTARYKAPPVTYSNAAHACTGEGGAIGSVPCVFNAVGDALAPLGVRLTGGPLSPHRIRAAIIEAGG